MNIVGIAGLAGSGKSTVADILVKNHGFVCVNLADPLKRIAKEVFNFTDEQLWGPSEMRNKPDERYPLAGTGGTYDAATSKITHHIFVTPRRALQTLGTEWGRALYENVWIDKALDIARSILESPYPNSNPFPSYSARFGKITLNIPGWGDMPEVARRAEEAYQRLPHKGVVIADVRFPNELARILDEGGRLFYRLGEGLKSAAGRHTSETSLPKSIADVATLIPWESDVKNLEAVIARLMEK